MKIMLRTIGVLLMSMVLVLTTGCVNPDGTQNNTGTGALIGGALGALAGAAGGGQYAGQHALAGAAFGAFSGALIGNMIDQEQQQRLQQQSPQTWQTIQYNDAVYQRQQQAAQVQTQGQTPGQAPPTEVVTPITVDDIKALTAAGVRTDAIKKEIEISRATFNSQDIVAAQQANPPVAQEIIECMMSHAS